MVDSDLKNPIWRNLVLNKVQVNLNCLAAKILISRWQLALRNDSSEKQIEKAILELFELYTKDQNFPNVKKDLALLLKN